MDFAQEDKHCSRYSDSTDSSLDSDGDFKGLRRVRDDVPWRLWAVAFVSFWERATFWGITAPWQNYMQNPSETNNEDTPGALNLGQATATRIYCAFFIGYYVAPLGFSVLSDSYLGRYKTLLLSLILYAIGCIAITLSSVPSFLARGWGLPGLVIAMVCIALGGGGFQANIPSFLADQCIVTPRRIKILKTQERVVTDRAITLQYIYNLNFWLGNVGSMLHFATVTLEKLVGFTAAFALTGGCIVIAALVLLLGGRWYVRLPHEANVYPQATKIILCASRNGFRMSHADPVYQLEHRQKTVSWSGQLVAELKRALRASRVLLGFIVFWTCFDQMQNNLISQASSMQTNGTPNDMLSAMNQVGCIIFVPLWQNGLLPLLHKRNIYLKPVTRIAIGFGFMTLAMLYASVVQHLIYRNGPCYEHPKHCDPDHSIHEPNQVNVWIQAPVYFFLSLSEIFAWVTAIEYAYEQAPKDMKTVVQAISLLIAGLGSAVAMTLTTVSRDPNMVIFYASLASAMAATGLVFFCIFRNMKDFPSAEDKATMAGSMPLQGLSSATLSETPTGKSQLSLETPSQWTPSREDATLADNPPASRQGDPTQHKHLVGLAANTTRTDSGENATERARDARSSSPTPVHPAAAVLKSSPGPPNEHFRRASSTKSNTTQSSGYDTADEYAPRNQFPKDAATRSSHPTVTVPRQA